MRLTAGKPKESHQRHSFSDQLPGVSTVSELTSFGFVRNACTMARAYSETVLIKINTSKWRLRFNQVGIK